MSIKLKNKLKYNTSNFFGVLGYLFCSFQWLWVVLLYFSLIQNVTLLVTPSVGDEIAIEPLAVASQSETSIFFVIIIASIVVMMAGLTIYILIKMPSMIVKTSKDIVHGAAENFVPIVLRVQHKKETKKNKLSLTPGLIIILKLILLTVPLILGFFSYFLENQNIGFYVSMCISLWLACFTFISFVLQYSLGRLFKLKMQEIL